MTALCAEHAWSNIVGGVLAIPLLAALTVAIRATGGMGRRT